MTELPRRTLIVTLPPYVLGGVVIKAHMLADHLRGLGHRVTVAHYATMTREPDLTVSLPGLLAGRRPAIRRGTCFGDHECVAVGCALPELEESYTRDSPRWRGIVEAHDQHVAVGGTVLAATPLVAAGVPHLIWCATDVIGDRIDRRNAMWPPRRLYDRTVVTPLLKRAERRVLAGPGRIMGVSPYTIELLRARSPDPARPLAHVPIPVDTGLFAPAPGQVVPGRIGFVARLSDPRKNIGLLLRAFARIAGTAPRAELVLVGEGGETIAPEIARLGLRDRVRLTGPLARGELVALYRSFDVFAIPSHQEGLGLVGVEAMACGAPVVSTRCGGPEAYVHDARTGYLVAPEADAMAGAIARIVGDRDLRARLSAEGRALLERDYSPAGFASAFAREWKAVWNEDV